LGNPNSRVSDLVEKAQTLMSEATIDIGMEHDSDECLDYFSGGPGVFISAGALIVQWVFIQPGVQAPDELALQFHSFNDGTWNHRAHWGYGLYTFCSGSSCSDRGLGPLPSSGRWVPLTVRLGATTGSPSSSDIAMSGQVLDGVRFTVIGGSGFVWWGPTLVQLLSPPVSDPTRATSTFAYDQYNDVVASVDPNGVASAIDYNASGQVLQAANGSQPLGGHTLSYTSGSWTPEANGYSGAT
jgi:YD repeat-containing protein